MKITVGKDNFNNVKDFITYLETTFEQDKLAFGEVTLSLECDELIQEELNDLADFLLKPERPRLYKFEFPPQQSHYQLPFDNVYLMNKRQKFSLEFRNQVAELADSSISFQSPIHKIRKTKRIGLRGQKVLVLVCNCNIRFNPSKSTLNKNDSKRQLRENEKRTWQQVLLLKQKR